MVLTNTYNNRLQPNELKASSTGGNAFDISYNFIDSASQGNAGHVYGITNNLDTTRSQTFGYDPLNRIISAQTTSTHATSAAHCWGESYTVDAWGNLITNAATTNPAYTGCLQESGFTKTADNSNHLSGFGYDVSGNTLNDGVVTNYVWDGESQLKSAAGVTYSYGGQGRRAAKVGSKFYWYGSGGEILAETNASGATTNEYIFFGGKRIALLPAAGAAQFYAEDLLGSSRVVTTNTGTVCYDADFYPYGGERTPYTNTCTQNAYKFEGKERDAETGNDDFGARYYSNRFGRWLSADWSNVPAPVPYANLTNPQTLNLYSMVADDPESFADLDGHFSTPVFAMQPGGCGSAQGMFGYSTPECSADEMANAEAKYNENVREAFAQADAAAKAKQEAQNQRGLTVSFVSGQKDFTGAPLAEAAAGFTVAIKSSTNFVPGDLTITADLHFNADKKVAEGTSVLLGADAENSQSKIGGQESPKTVNSVRVDVRPYNQTGNFGGKISNRAGANSGSEAGYITFHVKDASGTTRNVQLNVQVVSKRVPGGLPLPSGAWVQRLTVPIPSP